MWVSLQSKDRRLPLPPGARLRLLMPARLLREVAIVGPGEGGKMRMKSLAMAASLVVCALSGAVPIAAQAQYAGSSAITTWSGQCSGSQRDWWDDMCMAWRHKMGDKGWVQWWRNFQLVQ